MKKELNIAALVMYSLLIFNAIATTASLMITYFENKNGEGFSEGLTAAIALIFAIISTIYTVLAIPPIALKIASIKNYRRLFVSICLPFDMFFVLANSALLIALLSLQNTIGLILIAFMLAVSIAALAINIALLVKGRNK